MKVAEIGEFGLIDMVATDIVRRNRDVLVGIGDDAAVWRSPAQPTIATTDILLQGIHFDLHFITPYELGWKALAANLSDIAAMGGVPQYALVTLGVEGNTEVNTIREIYRGITALSDQFGVSVVGGDTVDSPHGTLIGITLIGHAWGDSPRGGEKLGPVLTRSAAIEGDLIAVTGCLGSSAAGLAMMRKKPLSSQNTNDVLRLAHSIPLPRVKEGQTLLRAGVKSAMDISDGTAGDLAKLCKASGVGAKVWLSKLPIRAEVKTAFPDRFEHLALYGGEDYELLFTAPAGTMNRAVELVQNETGTSITIIGECTADNIGSVVLIAEDGIERLAEAGGYDHFIAAT